MCNTFIAMVGCEMLCIQTCDLCVMCDVVTPKKISAHTFDDVALT